MDAASELPYAALVGALQWLSVSTRPDLGFAVGQLARYLTRPSHALYRRAIHVLQYLRGTGGLGLLVRKRTTEMAKLDLQAYTDANWAACKETRRSVSGVLLLLNGMPVHWVSRMQSTTATSSTESEFLALALCTREVLGLRNMLSELGYPQYAPTEILCDNSGAVAAANSSGISSRLRHVEVASFAVREHIEGKRVSVVQVGTSDNLADMLTKGLTGPGVKRMTDQILSAAASQDRG